MVMNPSEDAEEVVQVVVAIAVGTIQMLGSRANKSPMIKNRITLFSVLEYFNMKCSTVRWLARKTRPIFGYCR
jgi:hypothetical protein